VIQTGPRQLLGPVLFLLLLVAAPLIASAQPVQEALLRARPAVALLVIEITGDVSTDCGGGSVVTAPGTPFRDTGTAWFVHPSGWLITSAHVVAAAQEPRGVEPMLRESGVKAACMASLLERRGVRPGERPDIEDEVARQLTARVEPNARLKVARSIVAVLTNGTRLPARVTKYSAPVGGVAMSGRDLALLRIEATDVPTLPLGDSSQARIGDRLHVIGFPSVVTSHELLRMTARAEPSVTSGAVSGFKEDVNGQPVIQTDAAAAGGDSGGPAVNDRGEVVGVMTLVSRGGGAGDIVQGFNFIIPAASVREFLKDSGVIPGEPGTFTRAWWAGLGAFFAGDLFDARTRFAEANRVLPNVPDVQRMIAENDERIKNRPFPWRSTGMVLTLVGAIGCALAWVQLWKRNRFRVRPRDVARLLDDGETSPLILDVRDSETYGKSPVRLPHALHVPAERLAAAGATLPIESARPVVAYCT
jgi:S1-C subfamily serine protease